ncbi:MAG: ABC transporter permease [Candidatus Woesearchaeota archaeon]|nr:ABC transporter permease [Candidatus Woesearchaeota archaeon]
MHKVLKIIKKNIRLLVKSKGSALIVILGPLLLIFLAGIAFDNSNAYKINIGVYSPESTPLIASFVDKLKGAQFQTIEFESESSCIESIKQGRAHTCVVFPAGMDFSGNKTNSVLFYVDYSKVNLVWMVRDTLFSKISERTTEITTGLADVLLTKMRDTVSELNSKKSILTELSTTNTKTAQDVIAIKSSLNSLDLSMSKDSFNIAVLKNQMSSLNDIARQTINLSIDTLNSIKTSNNSGIINSAIDDLSEINATLQSTYGGNSSSLLSLITSVEAKLDETKAKLDKAGLARSDASSKIDAIKALLDSDLKKIAILQNSFNSISQSLGTASMQSAEAIASPVTTVIKPVITRSYLGYMFPILIVMLTMFVSIILSTTIIMMEKKSSAHFRNLITPTSSTTFFFAAYLTSMLLAVVQIFILLFISMVFFNANILRMIPVIGFLLILISTLFILMGIAIGYLFHSEETATMAAISISSIFLLLSNVVLPIESMPSYVMKIAQFNPFVISESLLKKAIVFNTSVFSGGNEILWLIVYIIILLAAILFYENFTSGTSLRESAKALIPQKPFEKGRISVIERIRGKIGRRRRNVQGSSSEKSYVKEKRSLSDANSLGELIEMLESMDSEEFSRYSRDEFAQWVKLNIREEGLVERILRTESKKEMEDEFRQAYDRHLKRIAELKKQIDEKKRKLNLK